MSIVKYKTKQGVRYRARIRFQGQDHASGGHKTKKEAEQWKVDKRRELQKSLPQENQNGILSSLIETYLEDLENKSFQYNTIRQKHFVFQTFINYLGYDPPLNQVIKKQIKDYINKQCSDRGPKAANRDLRDIHALFNWAIREEHLTHNPADKIEKFSEDKTHRYVPPPEDVAAVILAANREERDLIEAYLNTATRMGEIFNLKKQDVDLSRNTMWVWTRKRKGGEKQWRSVGINKTMLSIIKRRMQESQSDLVFENPRTKGPYQKNQHSIKKLLPRLCKKAEVKEFTMHAFRHFASTKAAAAYERGELTLRELQKLLGHQRLSTTEIYIESLQTDTHRIVNILGQEHENRS